MDSTDFDENNCVICLGEFSTSTEAATVVTKGISSLIDFSKQRGDVSLQAHLEKQNEKKPLGRVLVHAKCRRAYVDPKRAKRSSSAGPPTTPKKLKLRSNQPAFQWKSHCFFCDEKVRFDSEHPDRHTESRRVGGKEESVLLIERIRIRCDERDDSFGSDVRKRLSVCGDLVADEAVYHIQCHAKFFLDKPKDTDRARGRPECPKMQAAFNQMCDWLENEIELFTLDDIRKKMAEMSEMSDEEVYGVKRIKQKLQDRYKDNIFFAEVSGRKNVVCFRNMASWIVSDQWYKNKKSNTDEEAKRIIETAAKIIKNDLKEFLQSKCSTKCYPSIDDARSIGWIPDHLRLFLSSFIRSELKVEAIGQCLMKAAMPRSVMPPILFALAVELDHMFASRWLNTQLFSLGFAESYNEVIRFKQGVVMTEDIEDILQSRVSKDSFTTFVADNVDHNIATLDGKGTFHGMGVIAVITNKGDFNAKQPVRLRPTRYTKVDELVKKKGIPITSYDFPSQRGLDTIIFKPHDNVMSFFKDPISSDMDQLWHAAGLFCTMAEPRPNWNGFMQDITKGDHPSRSDTVLLPIIDLNPNDETCIYSTLLFVIEQSKKLNVTTPSITFDQPLWIKALEIITAKELNIVPLLGGFHMLMSFYGSIGTIMAGSGIDKLFENIYGQNAVKHMLAGKAVSRANRAHILTESALLIKLQRMALSENSNEGVTNVNLEVIQTLYKTVLSKTEDVDIGIPAMQSLQTILEETKKSLRDKSRTARLWLQYIEYVETCRNFIRAARTGNWNMHLYAISKMINLYAATGHINYAKSARIYLQLMLDLRNTHPWLYHKFCEEGLFIVRRSDRFWAGLWPDLTIEQVMMRAIKSRGGLTRGSGFTESVRTLWIYSMHATASYHDALSSLTQNQNKTSDQHEDLGKSRLQRDYNDLQKLITWLDYQSHDPFDPNRTKLQALDSGLIADESVTCDDAESIGMCIQRSLDNVSLSEASVKRSQQAITLASLKPSVKVGNQQVVIDPMVLFSRLIVLLQRNDDIANYFAYELAPVPTALFKENMMRKPTKSALAKALDVKYENYAKKTEHDVSDTIDGVTLSDDDDIIEMNDSFAESAEEDDDNEGCGDETVEGCNEQNVERYVVDGGYLLRRVVWDKQSTYQEIIQKYINYVESHYGKCSVVFDGYQDGPSIKDHEHFRRLMKASVSPNVSVHMENSVGSTSQKAFLSNVYNKQCLIDLLAVALESNGHSVVKCNNDADTAIVSTVLDYACENKDVCLVGADTDLLIMLLYMWNDSMGRITMKCEGSKKHKESIRDIGKMAESLEDVRKYLTFIHAFGGCDTTSATFGLGKMSILKLIEKRKDARKAAVFLSRSSSPEAVGEAGSKLFVMLYSGKHSDTLSPLRYSKYMKMASGSTSVKPESLPPSVRAAYFHALRVYLQVQEWNTLQESNLNPEDWGWRLEDGSFVPIMTDKSPAPDELLNVIRCNCRLTSKNPCGRNNCSCRANGLNCVAACGDCRGTQCMNCKTNAITENNVEDGEEYEGNIFENIFGV